MKETVYQMDPVAGLVPEQENLFHPGELSYIEGGRALGAVEREEGMPYGLWSD